MLRHCTSEVMTDMKGIITSSGKLGCWLDFGGCGGWCARRALHAITVDTLAWSSYGKRVREQVKVSGVPLGGGSAASRQAPVAAPLQAPCPPAPPAASQPVKKQRLDHAANAHPTAVMNVNVQVDPADNICREVALCQSMDSIANSQGEEEVRTHHQSHYPRKYLHD
ncbi:unnamed protein product [Bemisia tabaci]|uniref:Uncharacterized protein n=1 Tax=Bemisia tabaci TaxID=7038 RepID=A0A9P0AEG2_BEMTA|nr:unnamed protein product [Bemisia tabaci]